MIPALRSWTSIHRTDQDNLRLGASLCFVAGATNAGGFLAVGQYTSHMTGVVSSIADNMVLGNIGLALAGLIALVAFVCGAMTTAWMVNWSFRHKLQSAYGGPLMLEAVLLIVFGLFGAGISVFAGLFVPLTVLLLCYIMGLQNAVITKISHAEIRTTHITCLVTDLGIELGRLLYVNRITKLPPVLANRHKLRIQTVLIASFFSGSILGAIGFKFLGFISTLPLACFLVILVFRSILRDFKTWIDTPRVASISRYPD